MHHSIYDDHLQTDSISSRNQIGMLWTKKITGRNKVCMETKIYNEFITRNGQGTAAHRVANMPISFTTSNTAVSFAMQDPIL